MLLHYLFISAAKRFSNKIAIYDQATGKDLTYFQVLVAALIFADKIKHYHSKHIGVLLPASSGSIITIIATLFAKKVPVMINYSTGIKENCIFAQKKISFRVIISSRKMLEKLGEEPIEGMIFVEDLLQTITLADKVKASAKAVLPLPALKMLIPAGDPEDSVVILFTSGSEKNPKAVQLSHKNICHNLIAFRKVLEFNEKDSFITNLPYFHVFGLTVELWLPITLGASIVAHPNPLDYKGICDCFRKYKVTVLVGTPTFLYGYLRKSSLGDFESVRIAVSGADKLNLALRDEYRKKHNIDLLEGYGTTETSPVIALNSPMHYRTGSVGKPIYNVQVKIVDIDTDKELGPGEIGKILVRGDLVMKGYYNDIEETSVRIRNGWYDTGDMGMMDEDGYLFHKGRLKRFVKIGGEMVSLVFVEDNLEKVLPEGTICCVVEIPDPVKGAEIVAAVTTQEINQKHIKKLLSKQLPSIAIPKRFHVIEDIPLMPNGKVNFRAVEEICRNLEKERK